MKYNFTYGDLESGILTTNNIPESKIKKSRPVKKPKTQDCIHLWGHEIPEKYDGIWEWTCQLHNTQQCRWKLDKLGRREKIDDKAIDKLCKGCKDYNSVRVKDASDV